MPPGVADARLAELEENGLSWWFRMDYLRVATLLVGLDEGAAATPRIAFLRAAVFHSPQSGDFERHFVAFTLNGDREGQYAATCAEVLSIWSSGADLQRYDQWHERIVRQLADRIDVSPLAVGALLGFKGLIELTGENNLLRAAQTYRECLDWCERAGAVPLRAYQTTMRSYAYFWQGELARAELLLADAASLCAHPDTPWPVIANFGITRALSFALQGRMKEAREAFQRVTAHPEFAAAPPSVALLCYGHQLFALAQQGLTEEVEDIAEHVRQLAIPESNYFHHSYLHFCLGIAQNLLGRPAIALLHARHAIDIGQKSHSAIARRMPALVVGQALVDLGQDREATEHLTRWIEEWRDSGYAYFAYAGGLELASVFARRGQIERAREAYKDAAAQLPPNEVVPQLLRPPGFALNLRRQLFERSTTAWLADGRPARPVHITTFGELAISIRGRPVYDRHWRGGRTRMLLKALLAFGPDKVRLPLLADTLWPDSDADKAMGNLKVALSRLRRIGCEAGESPLPWIVVRDGCVSLPAGMCFIDFAAFQQLLDSFGPQSDIESFVRALEMHSASFLAKDVEAWIVDRRQALRLRFVQGVVALAERCLDGARGEVALPLLQRAVAMEPDNEILCGLLMDIHMRSGYPSQAIGAFRFLQDALRGKQAGEPGVALKERYARALLPV